jgi:hypothetical protein
VHFDRQLADVEGGTSTLLQLSVRGLHQIFRSTGLMNWNMAVERVDIPWRASPSGGASGVSRGIEALICESGHLRWWAWVWEMPWCLGGQGR